MLHYPMIHFKFSGLGKFEYWNVGQTVLKIWSVAAKQSVAQPLKDARFNEACQSTLDEAAVRF